MLARPLRTARQMDRRRSGQRCPHSNQPHDNVTLRRVRVPWQTAQCRLSARLKMSMDLSLALANIEDFYRRIYWHAPGAVTHTTPDYTLSYSGVAFLHSVNQLWLHSPDALNDDLMALSDRFFASYHAEYSIVFT